MYEEREAELDRQDMLDTLEEERNVAKARSAFYHQQARRYQSREVRAKTYNVGELVIRLLDKKKNKLKPKWEGPFIIDQVLTSGAYDCGMHRLVDSSRTHGTRPGSEDSTPKYRTQSSSHSLCPFSAYASSVLFPFLSFISLGLQGSPCASLVHYRCASRTLHTGGLLSQKLKLFSWASRPTHVIYFRMYLFSPL